MTAIAIVKKVDTDLNDQQRPLLASVLFEMLGGLTETDQKRWRGVWRELMAAGSGEVFTFDISINRNGHFHRRHMVLETTLFEAQEQYHCFTHFRDWLKVGAGFCELKLVRGILKAEPKSIAYDKCDQMAMEQFHNDAIAFLRTRHAQAHLYPHLSLAMAEEMIETILSEFES